MLATSVLLLLLWNPGRAPGAGQVAVNLTMFQSAFGISHVDGVYWTLWVEMKFYLLMIIFLLIGITTRRVLIVALAWPLVSWAFALAEVPHVWDWLIYRHAPFFAGGMVIYLIHCRGHSLARWAVLAVNVALGLVHGVPGLSTQVAERTPLRTQPVDPGRPHPGLLRVGGGPELDPAAVPELEVAHRDRWPDLSAVPDPPVLGLVGDLDAVRSRARRRERGRGHGRGDRAGLGAAQVRRGALRAAAAHRRSGAVAGPPSLAGLTRAVG
ncbi:acyltransferase family protein [Sanguibacter sp. Z1732]|uniref:acyltransferase family protein n=1 Tax=Sanguibacter sp. Z1732 TaxID=3435412 RepID=UPI003D9CA299